MSALRRGYAARRGAPRARASALALLACALPPAGCDFLAFDQFRNNTPVVALGAPSGWSHLRFAEEIAFASSDADGDWVIASGGLGTATVALQVRSATGALFPRSAQPRYLCRAGMDCAMTPRTGAALAGLGAWQGAPLCGLTGAFGALGGAQHVVHFACFGGADPARGFDVSAPSGFSEAGFGQALAVPRRRAGDAAPRDLVFVGATAGTGQVFVAQPSVVTNITPMRVPADAQLGIALAAGRVASPAGGADLLLVAGAPGVANSTAPVQHAAYVFRGDPRAGRPMALIGCVARPDEPDFGAAVAVGDLDGDGDDDVIVGTGSAATGRRGRVHVFLSAQRPPGAPTSCDATSWPEAALSECTSSSPRAVTCANTAGLDDYGSAVTAADLDADGRDELVVGAPRVTVAGAMNAGAIWVLRATGRAGAGFALSVATVLRDASPEANTTLGNRLITARVGDRDELIAAAGGAQQVMVYLCTGLPGDRPNDPGLDAQCRPR